VTESRTRTSVYRLLPEGVVEQCVLAGARQSVADAEENLATFVQMAGGRKAPALVDLRSAGPIEPGVNAVYAGEKAVRHTAAVAIVVGSMISQVIGNFFLAIQNQKFPCRLFTSRDDALRWLAAAERGGEAAKPGG
jgi:hypothetical protein